MSNVSRAYSEFIDHHLSIDQVSFIAKFIDEAKDSIKIKDFVVVPICKKWSGKIKCYYLRIKFRYLSDDFSQGHILTTLKFQDCIDEIQSLGTNSRNKIDYISRRKKRQMGRTKRDTMSYCNRKVSVLEATRILSFLSAHKENIKIKDCVVTLSSLSGKSFMVRVKFTYPHEDFNDVEGIRARFNRIIKLKTNDNEEGEDSNEQEEETGEGE